jgi:hypothetical protein
MLALPPHIATAPRPVLGPRHHAGTHRVALHVPQGRQQMLVLLAGYALEPALIQVPVAHRIVGLLPALGVGQCQPSHERRQFAIAPRPEDQVPMIGHQAPAQHADRQTLVGLEQHPLEGLEVRVLLEQPQPAVGAVENVIDHPAGSDACLTRHNVFIPAPCIPVKPS